MTPQNLFERLSIQTLFENLLKQTAKFIFRGNDFRKRSRYAIELRVLHGARARVPVPRARVSYLEQLNNSS